MTKLRPYQQEAFDSMCDHLRQGDSTLMVLPTGTGKTIIFAKAVAKAKGRTLVVAQRQELVYQAAAKIEQCGVSAEVEMGVHRATADDSPWPNAKCIVASVQSLNSKYGDWGKKRMHRFRDISLIVIDEAHHSCSAQHQEVIDYFRRVNKNLKVVGFTATPDRHDELRLPFESVAYNYELPQAIDDGWLVPIQQKVVHIASLDFADIELSRATGDFSVHALDATMKYEENLHGVCTAIKDIGKGRRTLLFTTSVHHAERACEVLNRYEPNSANYIYGKTPDDHRRVLLKDFDDGKYPYLSNCMVCTEGYDSPGIEIIAVASPTRSRAKYAQQVGRGMRPLTGIVDGLPDADLRKEAISLSTKPHLTVLDFTGQNALRHKLVSTADILGSKYPEEVRQGAARLAAISDEPLDMQEALEAEDLLYKKELSERKRKGIKATAVEYTVEAICPFSLLDVKPARVGPWTNTKPLSDKQVDLLVRNGINTACLNIAEQRQVMNALFRRIDGGMATFKQIKMLQDCVGLSTTESKKVTKERATFLISDYLSR